MKNQLLKSNQLSLENFSKELNTSDLLNNQQALKVEGGVTMDLVLFWAPNKGEEENGKNHQGS